ncbi:DUF5691 domain-containing protein [Methylobacterium gregans]|uniref:SWIM-type domain-containing protein n=1 Tax=Methylobacterium gregans TaxID=374424 RepID=A0AA37HLD6_9HYPH|nr:DUF5691 domain-containing protein [Methylobacterium gregans]MDQ0520055.1 hypothetical protein [Methylobacterium gregans]GJD77002.1 hypothetical protein NBEOAGPD_0203 [Methylobacterium gregans]GLS52456.1 hypothetical protein GCM10007886_06390 [Methylobacterium gregans]
MIWGEIKGSGASPYRTVADLSGPAAKCSCPSRKFPCKHALGLRLVDAAAPIDEAAAPAWVEAWAKGRETRAAAAETRAQAPTKPVDERAQAKRRQAREGRVAAALDEFDLWLCDLMRRGLSSARAEPYAFWDRMAGRLLDGQAPGMARRVRALPGLVAAVAQPGAPRPEAALGLGLGRLALLVRAARRLDALQPEQAAGVRTALGFPVTNEEMAARPDHTDDWAVLAHSVEEEDKLTVRSVWLVGRASCVVAQVLDYGTAASPLPAAPTAGQDFSGALAFQPGDPPLRAVFRDGQAGCAAKVALPGAASVAAARDAFAAGVRAPAWLLQALAGQRDTLPEPIDRIAGPEFAWLARACGEAPAETADASSDWTVGTLAERSAAFTALRARDPGAARVALEPVFRKEKADLRNTLVNALATGLSEADEPFSESCLDDRGSGVRLAAQRLLPLLPGSRYASRMSGWARAALTVESKRRLLGGTTHALVLTLPEESPELVRDSVDANAWESRNGGARSALLRAILARAPLDAFADHPPRLWIALALGSEGRTRSSTDYTPRPGAPATRTGRARWPRFWPMPMARRSRACAGPPSSSVSGRRLSTSFPMPTGRRGSPS